MNHSLVTRLALDSAGSDGATTEVTQPVAMQGNNTVSWDATLYALTTGNVAFQLQVSNDLENWTNVGTAQNATAVGHKMFTAETAIAAAYVRLKITPSTGKAVVAASMTLSAQ